MHRRYYAAPESSAEGDTAAVAAAADGENGMCGGSRLTG
jgi:hypothetical protein